MLRVHENQAWYGLSKPCPFHAGQVFASFAKAPSHENYSRINRTGSMIALSAHSTGVAPPSGAHRYMLASTARRVCRVGWCPPTPSACAAFGTSLTCHAAPPSHSSISSASPSSPLPSLSHQGGATTHGSGLMLTLERSVGHSSGNDAQLCASGLFQAEVFPDLPIATTWGNLAKALLPRYACICGKQ